MMFGHQPILVWTGHNNEKEKETSKVSKHAALIIKQKQETWKRIIAKYSASFFWNF